jgi:hypothetical protein
VASDGAGDEPGDVATEDVVAAEGADGSDLVDGGGVGVGGVGGRVEFFALARGGLGGEEAAVGGGDGASADGVEEEREEG